MKIIWEPNDLCGGDCFISNKYPPNHENIDFGKTVAYKIVYTFSDSENTSNNYGICHFLTDGLVSFRGSKEKICEFLNNEDCRKLCKNELLKILNE